MVREFRRVVRVLIASPDDVKDERAAMEPIFAELNRLVARERSIYLDKVMWETNTRPTLGDVQERIFEQLGTFDLVIGILWARFGTPTKTAGSGTEAELREALERHQSGALTDLLMYFRLDDIPAEADLDQAQRVKAFRAEYKSVGGYREYRGVQGFVNQVSTHLRQWVMEQPALHTRELEKGVYLIEEADSGPIDCITDRLARRTVVAQNEAVHDESDLFYLLVENVISCEETRNAIKHALHPVNAGRQFPNVEFEISGLYDTMGKWDVLARFRAPGFDQSKALRKYLGTTVLNNNPNAGLRLVNIDREGPHLRAIQNGGWKGTLQHRWMGSTGAYRESRCQRFFLYIELPDSDRDQRLLIKELDDVIGKSAVAGIIESVAYAEQDRALILEIFTTCSDALLIHELNRLVESRIPSFKKGKSTLCCFESDEKSFRTTAGGW